MIHKHHSWQFKPHSLVRGGHLQTVLGIFLPRRDAPYAATQHRLPLEGMPGGFVDDQLVLHEDRPDEWQAGDPIALLVHGLAGCHMSSYMVRLAERLTERGRCVFRMDMRGCGAGETVARSPTHCGASGDVAAAVRFIAELHPESPTDVIGFSLGGAISLRMLIECGQQRIGNLQRVLAVCPPIDLFSVERNFDTWLGLPYDKFFARRIWRQVLQRWERFPEIAPTDIPARPRRLKQIDEMVIAPAAGYASAEEYYAGTQVGPGLASIRQSATILATENDPIIPIDPLYEYPRSSDVEVIVAPCGGHLGFLASSNGDPDFRWLDWRIVEWVERDR